MCAKTGSILASLRLLMNAWETSVSTFLNVHDRGLRVKIWKVVQSIFNARSTALSIPPAILTWNPILKDFSPVFRPEFLSFYLLSQIYKTLKKLCLFTTFLNYSIWFHSARFVARWCSNRDNSNPVANWPSIVGFGPAENFPLRQFAETPVRIWAGLPLFLQNLRSLNLN